MSTIEERVEALVMTMIRKATLDHGLAYHDPINERLDVLEERVEMTDEQVKNAAVSILQRSGVEEEIRNLRRDTATVRGDLRAHLNALEERTKRLDNLIGNTRDDLREHTQGHANPEHYLALEERIGKQELRPDPNPDFDLVLERSDFIEGRIGKLESALSMLGEPAPSAVTYTTTGAKPVLHERDEHGHWICCCGDSLEEAKPIEPSELVDLVAEAIRQCPYLSTPPRYAATVAIRAVAEFLEKRLYGLAAREIRRHLEP